jgi:hypothetical protein
LAGALRHPCCHSIRCGVTQRLTRLPWLLLLLLLLLLLRCCHLQLFDAPQLVRHALNNVCNLDGSYVMTSHDLDAARALMEAHRGVRRVYSPQVRLANGVLVVCACV